MDVVPPKQFKFTSTDGKYTLIYPRGKTAWVVNKTHPEKKMMWKGIKPDLPSTVLIAPAAGVVYFIGGFGDSGSDLGKVTIHDLDTGKIRAKANVEDVLPDLEKISREYTLTGNFEWISHAELIGDGHEAMIEVCKKWKVKVHSKDGKLELK